MAGGKKAFELIGEVTVDPRKPVQGLRTVEKQFKTTAANIGKMSASFGSAGGGGGIFGAIGEGLKMLPGLGTLASGFMAVTGAVKDGIKFGFDYRRILEENTIAFEVMLGSADKARVHLQDLARFAETSPFEFPEILQASKKMQAMGFSVQEIVPSLRAVSDASAALGSDMDGIILALGQMRQKGKVSAEEMNQLVERGIPAWEILSKAIGKTTQETMKLGEQGRLSGKGAAQAILIGMQDRFKGLGDRFAKETASGLEANLNDVAARLAGTASGSAFEAYKGLLRKTLSAANSETASALAQGVSDFPGEVLKGFGQTVSDVTGGAEKIGVFVKGGLTKGFDAVGTGISHGVDYVGGFAQGIGANSPAKEFIPLGQYAAQGFKIGFADEMQSSGGIMGLFQNTGGGRLGGQSERAYLESLSQNPTVRAFFEAIRRAEGGEPNIMAGGRRVNSGAAHPGEVVPRSQWFRGDRGPSSAAGNWQITRTNWRNLAPQLGLDNFSDVNQQLLAALKLFNDRQGGVGTRALLSGDIETAMRIAARDWTSTPGSTIGGGGQLSRSRWMGHFQSALAGGGAVPVTIVGAGVGAGANLGSRRAGDLAGGTGGFASLDASVGSLNGEIEMLDNSFAHLVNVTTQPLEKMPEWFNQAAQSAAGMNEEIKQTEPILMAAGGATERFKELMADLKESSSLDWVGVLEGGQAALSNFFTDLQDGWKSALGNMGLAFAQSLQQMAAQALASQVWGFIMKLAGSAIAGGMHSAGHNIGLNTPFVGGYASGTFSARPGLALVGERGPELVGFGGGERVFNNAETRGMLGGGTTVNVHVHGVQNPAQFMESTSQIQRKMRRAVEADALRRGRN